MKENQRGRDPTTQDCDDVMASTAKKKLCKGCSFQRIGTSRNYEKKVIHRISEY